MTMLASEPAVCRKCGNKQYYTKVITWNTMVDPEYPAHNVCYKCGNELNYDDIDLNTCSPGHREEIRNNKIYEVLHANDIYEKCPKCCSNKWSHVFCSGIKLPDKYNDKKEYSVHKSYHKCSDCNFVKYDTTEDILDCGLYEFVENGLGEHEYIFRKVDNFDELIKECEQEIQQEREKIENELISKGIITTREEEKEYSDNYYVELRNKYSDLFDATIK